MWYYDLSIVLYQRGRCTRYFADGESDSDIWLTPTYSMESDSSKSAYPTCSVGSYHSKSSQLSVIRLSLDSSALSIGLAPPLIHGRGFIYNCTVPHGHGHALGGGGGMIDG